MSDEYVYHSKAVALDKKLEAIMTSHDEAVKAAASKEEPGIGLQELAKRASIDEEINAIKTAAPSTVEGNINIVRTREKMASIVEEKAGRFDDFSSLTSPVLEKMTKEAAEKTAMDNRLAELRGSVTTERS